MRTPTYTVTAIDRNSNADVSKTQALSPNLTVQTPAALAFSAYTAPTHVSQGETFAAAVVVTNIGEATVDLAATAAIDRSKEAAAHALMFDPLTAAMLTPGQIRAMVQELFEAEKRFLPGYK